MKLLNIVLLFFGVLYFSIAATDFTKTPTTEYGEVKVVFYLTKSGVPEESFDFEYYALHALNVDADARIVGIITGGFDNKIDDPTGSIRTYTFKNSTYTYIGDRLKIGEGKEVGKYWSLVTYIRAKFLHKDDNEIFYAAPERIMRWKTVTSCDEQSTVYHKKPFIQPRIDVTFKGKNDPTPVTVVSHRKCDVRNGEKCTTNDWIANHGIFRMYDTRRFTYDNKRAVGDESMHLLYYAPIQHIASYMT